MEHRKRKTHRQAIHANTLTRRQDQQLISAAKAG
jgi:hypothetical protein